MTSTIRMCTRCRARPTFTPDAVCSQCRNVKVKTKNEKPSEVER